MSRQRSARGLLAGARDVLPLAFGSAVYGVAFGLLAAQGGFTPLQIAVMGALVYAGSSQIVATQQWIAGGGLSRPCQLHSGTSLLRSCLEGCIGDESSSIEGFI